MVVNEGVSLRNRITGDRAVVNSKQLGTDRWRLTYVTGPLNGWPFQMSEDWLRKVFDADGLPS